MFNATLELPLWLILVLATGCIYAVVMSALIPGIKWFFRRRLNRAIERINERLRIEIRPFQRTKRQVLIDRLIYDSQIISEIEREASRSDVSREILQARVYNYAREIIPAFNAVIYFRLVYWIARRISRMIYRVKVGAADYEKLVSVDPEATVVFVMNHRSNMDYLLVSYLAASQVSLSYAVGEWARVFPLRTLIKALGGFFVRRNSDDSLYRRVLERYVAMSTREGVSQAVFIEGQLSRDGQLGKPKLGFLDYMLRDWDMVDDRDIVFVPIGINYDHVLEDTNMIAMADESYSKGTWRHTGDVLRFIGTNLFASAEDKLSRYGYASVNFGVPLSAKDYCERAGYEFRRLEKQLRFEHVEKLAEELLDAIRHVMPVLPVPLVTTVLEEHGTLSASEVVEKVNELIASLIDSGSAMKLDEKPKESTIRLALRLLTERGILQVDDNRFGINEGSGNLVQYYANSIRQ